LTLKEQDLTHQEIAARERCKMTDNKLRFVHRADIQNALEAIAMLERTTNSTVTDEQARIEAAYWQGYRKALETVKVALVGNVQS
jgi:hypothetical protein